MKINFKGILMVLPVLVLIVIGLIYSVKSGVIVPILFTFGGMFVMGIIVFMFVKGIDLIFR